MIILIVVILALLAGGAWYGKKYLSDNQEENVVPFHSTPEKSALPPRPRKN